MIVVDIVKFWLSLNAMHIFTCSMLEKFTGKRRFWQLKSGSCNLVCEACQSNGIRPLLFLMRCFCLHLIFLLNALHDLYPFFHFPQHSLFFWKMRKIMESRIAEADEMRIAAEKEKLEKEKAARATLTEQESMMEKVVGESKIIQEAAEENSKVVTLCSMEIQFYKLFGCMLIIFHYACCLQLRNFLMDRGRVVDILQ